MAEISLRAYIREIEELVESGSYDQAIAHCKQILSTYPKHIDTYRLLGKSYLEKKQFGDAEDIFQRVLASIPDDVVSHVGMSMIREDEGNLDEAIWHMERAFEVSPSNSVIQNELKKLFGRRDGIEPPKINLTRGALARMYIKGGLHQQAINELRISLTDDPSRLDLQMLLARAYFQAGQKVEAAETCTGILNKLPNCFEANLVLSETLEESQRGDEARPYRIILSALNPYIAHISANSPNPELVSETAVMLEKLMLKTEQGIPSEQLKPEWTSHPGIQQEKEEIKSDVNNLGEEVPQKPETTTEQVKGPESLPDWMKEAGWQATIEKKQDEVPHIDKDETQVASEELAPAEIPEWLQSLAPGEGKTQDQEAVISEDSVGAENIPWLEETPPGESDSIVTWLKDLEDKESIEKPIESKAEETVPDWLIKLSEKAGFGEEIELTSDISATPTVSDQVSGDISSQQIEPVEELPDWLFDFEEEEKMQAEESQEQPVVAEISPEAKETVEVSPELEAEPPISEQDTKPLIIESEELFPESALDWQHQEEIEQQTYEQAGAAPKRELPFEEIPNIPDQLEQPTQAEEQIIFGAPDVVREDEILEPAIEEYPPIEPPTEEEYIPQSKLEKNLEDSEWQQEFVKTQSEESSVSELTSQPPGDLEGVSEENIPASLKTQEPIEETQIEGLPSQPPDELGLILQKAHQALSDGDSEKAGQQYGILIQSKKYLDEIIQDLDDNLYHFPMEIPLWTCLGDAYMRVGQLQKALDAYVKAEEILR